MNGVQEELWVTIPKEQYHRLLKDQRRLSALEEAGVGSWNGFDDVIQLFESEGEKWYD